MLYIAILLCLMILYRFLPLQKGTPLISVFFISKTAGRTENVLCHNDECWNHCIQSIDVGLPGEYFFFPFSGLPWSRKDMGFEHQMEFCIFPLMLPGKILGFVQLFII